MSNPKKVGVSGGIGSGKTFICKLIEERGYPVYYSDLQAKRLTNENTLIRQELIALFGEEVYYKDQLNRPFLANIIFNDDEKRKKVNQIIHPQVHSDFNSWAKQQKTDLVFYESALLFESQTYKLLDATILVVAPVELRIERTMKRDNATREQIEARISSQGNQESYRELATFCIENDLNSDVDQQLDQILRNL